MVTLTKTVKIINRRNVLVQIPGYIIASWPEATELEVYYDDERDEVKIKPAIHGRSCSNEKGRGVA